jgi:hypothetical protein
MKQQTIDGMKEWMEAPGGHYFLTPAEVQDVLDMQAAISRLQVIERVFFKLVSPDGFHQCGTNEECPECDEVGTHAEGCELDAVLNEAK